MIPLVALFILMVLTWAVAIWATMEEVPEEEQRTKGEPQVDIEPSRPAEEDPTAQRKAA
jgi:hypothetical protein